jgi:hypothetical protein
MDSQGSTSSFTGMLPLEVFEGLSRPEFARSGVVAHVAAVLSDVQTIFSP